MKNILFAIIILLFSFSFTAAQTRWSFELNGGVTHNLRLPLIFHQQGYPDIRINRAHYYSEPLIDPPYGMWRVSKWIRKKSIQFEYTHHKIYLKNTTSQVQDFGISHGFNMLAFNYGIEKGKFIFRSGLGSVLIHPESTVRGMHYQNGPGFDLKGYRLRGMVAHLSASRQFRFGKTFFINSEFKISGAVVNAPIVLGHARVHIVVFQLVLGPGFNWAVKENCPCPQKG